MNIEEDVFKKAKIDLNKLIPYGFKKEGNNYILERNITDDFKAIITINKNNKLTGKIYDNSLEDEYLNFRVLEQNGEFVNNIRNSYKNLLIDIKSNCFYENEFIFDQSNRIANYILKKYNVNVEHLWDSAPNYGVFRNSKSNKWFGIIMNVDKNKIVKGDSIEVEILNVKLDDKVNLYLSKKGIYESYHMSKKNWISIILDDTLSDEEIIEMINISYNLSDVTNSWIVPANPKYYDVVNAFNDTDTIIWKQSTNILIGDIVYLYVAVPYSKIMFKCEVIDAKIPYEYKDSNVNMKYVMKIKLLKRYNDEFTFKELNNYGIKSIRGPIKVPKKLNEKLL